MICYLYRNVYVTKIVFEYVTDLLSALGQLLQLGCGLPNAAIPAAGEIQRGETGEDH
jgi:hypothetical protein